MRAFNKGFWLVLAVVWFVPALVMWDILRVGPAIALIYSGSFIFSFFVALGLPALGGLVWNLAERENRRSIDEI